MADRIEDTDYQGKDFTLSHLQPCAVDAQTTILPVSITVLFDDTIRSCEYFAGLLEAEGALGGHAMLDLWQQTADALCSAEPSPLKW